MVEPIEIERFPKAVFTHLTETSTPGLRERYIEAVSDALRPKLIDRAELSAAEVAPLIILPEIGTRLGPVLLQHPTTKDLVLGNPMTAFGVLISNYAKFSRTLESLVLTDAEATYLLLLYARDKKVALRQPLGVYVEALFAQDLYWGELWARKTDDDALAHRVCNLAADHWRSRASAALIILLSSGSDPDERHQAALDQDPRYAYLAWRKYKDTGYRPSEAARLSAPQWACCFGAAPDNDLTEEKIEAAVVGCPGWTAQYLVESKRVNDWRTVARLYNQSFTAVGGENTTNPYLRPFRAFVERVKRNLGETSPGGEAENC